jgi:hypothetical protein
MSTSPLTAAGLLEEIKQILCSEGNSYGAVRQDLEELMIRLDFEEDSTLYDQDLYEEYNTAEKQSLANIVHALEGVYGSLATDENDGLMPVPAIAQHGGKRRKAKKTKTKKQRKNQK